MSRAKDNASFPALEALLQEASWLLSHAEALTDYGRAEEAAAELARAAGCEEEVASLLDAAGRDDEAAVHRVSAASCYEQLGQAARAMTLLRAALSAPLAQGARPRVEAQLTALVAKTRKGLQRPGRPERG